VVGDSENRTGNVGLLLRAGSLSHGEGMKSNILVIDDEESIRYSFHRFLAAEGHKVITAQGYREALARMNEAGFKLILADIFLNDGWGIDILGEVRQRNLKTRVIIMTAYPSKETADVSFRMNAAGYLVKPLRQEGLLNSVNQALRQYGNGADETNSPG
jgi:two-component system, NtrC family, response regulator HydG